MLRRARHDGTTGVMCVPGSALDMEGHVRIGFANNRAVLESGLAPAADFLNSMGGSVTLPMRLQGRRANPEVPAGALTTKP